MWVKICANTNLEDTQLAIDLGADAVGFVFAPSARRISPQQAWEITSRLLLNGRNVERIGVFQGSSFEDIRNVVALVGLTGVQIHDAPQPGLMAALHREFRGSVTLAQTLHWRVDSAEPGSAAVLAEQIDTVRRSGDIDRILVDTKAGNALGGTGLRFDWDSAGAIFRLAGGIPMIVAGGLAAENVREAVQKLNPWGIDVASGVEQCAGRKDPDRLRDFLRAARTAGGTVLT